MNIKVSVSIPKEMPVKQLDNFIDKTVYNTARITLDRTAPHIPRLSGDMERAIAGYGVRGHNKSYDLGYTSTNYAPIVWDYPQNTTNWTNPLSYSKWFITEFKNSKDKITRQAVNQAMKVVK